MSEEVKLLPCPFCGGRADFRWSCGVLLAECTNCGTSKGDGGCEPMPMGDGQEFHRAAATNWNRRPTHPESAVSAESMRDADWILAIGYACKELGLDVEIPIVTDTQVWKRFIRKLQQRRIGEG